MVPYNKDKEPSVARWASTGAMQASIVLDQPGNVAFTNLDEISGRVVVRCGKSVDVDSIVVKLEGESRTRLMSPGGPNGEKPRPQVEYHKVLYKVQMVFPPADVQESRSRTAAPKTAYTLPPGTHEYPWMFKLPFNNSCSAGQTTIPKVSVSTLGLELTRPATKHLRKTLPPTLSGFPGEAEIRYFVKATIARHSFFKENPRAYAPFNFFPIEPPRPPVSGSQVYARQRHEFSPFPESDRKGKMKEFFGTKSSGPAPTSTGNAPSVTVDARLPQPAILTCNHDVPLSVIVKRLDSRRDAIHLQSLQISLIANTKIRAHEVYRIETNSWIIMSKSNMGIRIGSENDPEGTETTLDDRLWRPQLLPNTVAPSFETCNITRTYQLDVRVGLSYGGSGWSGHGKPQSVILPLRLDTEIYSGIAPSPEVLERMAQARTDVIRPVSKISESLPPAKSDKLAAEAGMPPQDSSANPYMPVNPGGATMPTPADNYASQQPPGYEEAPPSYEDAITTDLPPVNAPRPDYAPPPFGDDDLLRRDEKRGWVE